MFEWMTQWHWVGLAWAHLILSYLGYLVYLRSRAKRASELAEERSSRS